MHSWTGHTCTLGGRDGLSDSLSTAVTIAVTAMLVYGFFSRQK